MDREQKQESSISTGARVSIVALAELDKYWECEGYQIKTMSQLMNWSLERLCEVVKSNGVIEGIESVKEAHSHLISRRLYQGGMLKRGSLKLDHALKFESLREEGVDPKDYVPQHYNIRHNERSVKTAPKSKEFQNSMQRTNWVPLPGYPDHLYPEGDEEARQKLTKQLEAAGIRPDKEVLDKATEEAIRSAKERGMIKETKASANLTEFEVEKREREYLENLNAPLDPEFIKKNIVRP